MNANPPPAARQVHLRQRTRWPAAGGAEMGLPDARTAPKGQRNPSPIATPIVPQETCVADANYVGVTLQEWYVEGRLTESCQKTAT